VELTHESTFYWRHRPDQQRLQPAGGRAGIELFLLNRGQRADTQADVERDLALLRGRTRQYVFISSASAYQKPVGHYRITLPE